MNLDKVRAMEPVNRLAYWIRERESIRLKKEADEPKPWTDDHILQSYRFCNVRRMDDKVSKWLMANWYTPYKNQPFMLEAAALARFINLPASLDKITKLVFRKSQAPDWEGIKETLRSYRDEGNTIFNGAYMVRGNNGIDKIECVVDYYVKPLDPISIYVSSMEVMWSRILSSFGMGSFMAGQIVADLRWAMDGTWIDRESWAPMGPGSKRGMNRLQGRDKDAPMNQSQFLIELRELIETLNEKVEWAILSRLEAIDYQNCLCEFDGYERALDGGRKKQNYPGR